jgi:hypothetical protein
MTRLVVLLLLCSALCACKTGPGYPSKKSRRRKPLFSFGNSEKRAKTTTPSELFMGDDAKRFLDQNKGQAIRIGSNSKAKTPLNLNQFKTIEELLIAYEQAKSGERPLFLKKLFALRRGDAIEAIERRRSELRFLYDSYYELAHQIDKKLKKPAPAASVVIENKQLEALYINRKFRLAIDQYLNGDFLGARRLSSALLLIAPNCAMAPKLKRLRKVSRERLLRESVLHTELLALPMITSNKSLSLSLKLTNRTEGLIVLVPARADSSPTLGSLNVSYEEQFAGGTRSRDQTVVKIAEKKAISLKRGQSITIAVKVPRMHRKKPSSVIGVYSIGGHLRPFKLVRDGQDLPYLVPIFNIRVHVVEQANLALVRDPLGSLQDSLDALDNILKYGDAKKRKERFKPKKFPNLERLLRATFLTAVLAGESAEQRAEAFEIIASQLKEAPARICQVLCSALSSITRDPFRYSKEEWLAWFVQKGHRAFLRPREKPLLWSTENRKD